MPLPAFLSSRERAVEAARSWIGTPFHHQARVKGVGVDCAGLVAMVAAECGFVLNDHPEKNYSRYPTAGRHLLKECVAQMRAIPLDQVKPGSIILFWVQRPGLPQHLAISSGPDTIIHAWAEARRVIETHLGPYWGSRIHSTFDLKEVE